MTQKMLPPRDLRKRAERRLKGSSPPADQAASGDLLQLSHELHVHQLELEMQNEDLRIAQAKVTEAMARYAEFYDFAPVGYLTLKRNGAIVMLNLAGAQLVGGSRSKLIGKRIRDFVVEHDRPVLEAMLQEVFATEAKQSCNVALARKDPVPRFVQIEAMLSHDKQECHAVVIDITVHKQVEARLQLNASVFTHAREGICITDADSRIVEVNDAFTRITGYSREEVLGRNPHILRSGPQSNQYDGALWKDLTDKGHWTGEIWNRRKNGDLYAEALTISALRDAAGKICNYVALFSDITSKLEHQKQLEHVAHYDPLTNLPNRLLLADRLQQAIAQSQRRKRSFAVVYLDLDGFKAVNDRYSHAVGDTLLIVLSQRMRDVMREGDTLARLGGDEFVAVLVDLNNRDECEPELGRLLKAAASPVTADDNVLQLSASVGVALYPQDGTDADQLLRRADQAMYVAKQTGKNRYHMFDLAQDALVRLEQESIRCICAAFERRQFVLYYQPKVNMKTGELIGAEALIRWQHPRRGLLLPDAFLPTIVGHPICVALGEWVINTALTQISNWRTAGWDIAVSVNVSACQLQDGDFVARLQALLAAHPDVQPSRLELEIVESSALENLTQIAELINNCRAIGVRFALDDFGTGYSSLTYLNRLPVDSLKIDVSFVRDMLDNPGDLAIVDGVVRLATAFNRTVVAEGVETEKHGDSLLPLGCDLAQGYGIGRPMPGAELPGWAANWQPSPAWTEWREYSANHDDTIAVFVEVEYRHRIRILESYLAGDRNAARPFESQDGLFKRWSESRGRIRFGGHPDFPALNRLDDRLHELSRELVELHAKGQECDARSRLAAIQTQSNDLIKSLRSVVRAG